jgi:hypothetical protein
MYIIDTCYLFHQRKKGNGGDTDRGMAPGILPIEVVNGPPKGETGLPGGDESEGYAS